MKNVWPEECGPKIVGGQIVGVSECAYHSGGGLASLPCAEAHGHDEDAPIYTHISSGTPVEVWLSGQGWTKATVLACEGTCDDRTLEVRPHRASSTVKVHGSLVRINGKAYGL